jgi:hypothetical protein
MLITDSLCVEFAGEASKIYTVVAFIILNYWYFTYNLPVCL